MKNFYVHSGIPTSDKMNFPFVKGILNKGHFIETKKLPTVEEKKVFLR